MRRGRRQTESSDSSGVEWCWLRLAIEKAPAGSRLHSVGDEGVPFRRMAETPVHFGFLGLFVTLDNPTSSAITRKLLDWEPTRPGVIADLEEDFYYER